MLREPEINLRDYYKDLDLKQDASADDIKKKFRKLALKYHPDRNSKDSNEDMFKRINEAYSVLSDPKARQEYDFRQNGMPRQAGFGTSSSYRDVWSDFFGDFGDIFGNNGNSSRSQRKPDPKVRFDIELSALEKGELVQSFSHVFQTPCATCSGAGGFNPQKCSNCNGTGKVAMVHQAGSIRIQNIATCGACSGRGNTFTNPCNPCKSSGTIKKKKNYKVTINTEVY